MERSFVSIHILNSNIDEVCWRLANCKSDLKNDAVYEKNILKIFHSNNVSRVVDTITSLKPKEVTFYFTEDNGNISVFSEYFESQIVKEQVKRWFAGFDKYVLIVDYLDSNYLEINIFNKYKFRTSLVDGKNLQLYNLTKSEFDVEQVCKIFNIEPEQIEHAYDSTNLFKSCSNLSDLFKLPLTLNTSDVINSKDIKVEKEKFYIGVDIG